MHERALRHISEIDGAVSCRGNPTREKKRDRGEGGGGFRSFVDESPS